MPCGGVTTSLAASGNGTLKGPNSLPKNPAEVKALSSSPSPTSRRWPMLMKAGTAAFFGPRVRDIIAPMCGQATDCGGA